MGLGAYPATDKQFLGMPGMHGTYEANMSMQHCDVLLAIGARFDDRVIGNPAHFAQNPRKIIHIDIDPSSISKRVKVDVPIVGNIPDVLDELLKLLRDSKPQDIGQWWKQIDEWRAKGSLRDDPKPTSTKPPLLLRKIFQGNQNGGSLSSPIRLRHHSEAPLYQIVPPPRSL